jgi:hypothetical protein
LEINPGLGQVLLVVLDSVPAPSDVALLDEQANDDLTRRPAG